MAAKDRKEDTALFATQGGWERNMSMVLKRESSSSSKGSATPNVTGCSEGLSSHVGVVSKVPPFSIPLLQFLSCSMTELEPEVGPRTEGDLQVSPPVPVTRLSRPWPHTVTRLL